MGDVGSKTPCAFAWLGPSAAARVPAGGPPDARDRGCPDAPLDRRGPHAVPHVPREAPAVQGGLRAGRPPGPGAGPLMSSPAGAGLSAGPRPRWTRRHGGVCPPLPWAGALAWVTFPFPLPLGSDTIPRAGRPPVCVRPVCRLPVAERRQTGVSTGRHAQAGRFSSTRFTRRARLRRRGPVLRGARRIKPYSFARVRFPSRPSR